MTAQLLLIRGLPGSGKSTMARALMPLGFVHFEADQTFMIDGEYVFQPLRLKEAHRVCLERTKSALEAGGRVVVSNTFTTMKEMEPYMAAAVQFKALFSVIEAHGNFESIHNVPDEVIQRMRSRWEL